MSRRSRTRITERPLPAWREARTEGALRAPGVGKGMRMPGSLRRSGWIGTGLLLSTSLAVAAEPRALDRKGFDPGTEAVVLVQLNWGRYWPCTGFENAQLLSMSFVQLDPPAGGAASLALEAPSRLFVDPVFKSHAYVLPAGTYALDGFSVKAAVSVRDIRIADAVAEDLMVDGKHAAGSFRLEAGEIVYVGGFGLDCSMEAVPWRYYEDGRASFEQLVARFRKTYPAVAQVPVTFRLFDTTRFGDPFELEDPVVR